MPAKQVKIRRGTTAEHSIFTGKQGEITVDLDKDTLIIHDESTAGGHPLAKEDMSNVVGQVGLPQLKLSNNGSAGQFLSTDGNGNLLFAIAGGGGTAVGGDLSGTVSNAQIVSNAILTDKIADDAVTEQKIADDAVTESKIADDAVGTSQIITGSIVDSKLNTSGTLPAWDGSQLINLPSALSENSVTTTELANDAVETLNIKDGNVTSDKIADDAVTNNKIANDAVTVSKIADNAVTETKIANNAVGITQLSVQADGNSGDVLSTDGNGVLSFIPISEATGGNTNPPSSGPQDAFLVGGSAGGITNPDIINYAFASDSQSVHGLSFNGTLGGGGIDGGTANSSTTDGYYSTGGSTPFRTDITRFSFASTGNAVSIGNTDRHRSAARIGTNSPTDGYIHGGRGFNVVGQLSSCIKFQFAESSTSSSAVFNLDTTKSNIGCHSTTTRGYLYGGANDPGVIGSCIEFVFANDQTRIDIQNLNESSGSHVALGNNTNAYICGGTAGGGVNFTRIDTHLLSSSASLTSHGDLNTAVNSHNGASTNISGITLCGTANGSNTSKKQTFSYASNVVATDLPAFTLAFEGPGACQVPASF
jgi:hypothetical protein